MRTLCALAGLAACTGTSAHTTDVKPTLSFAALDDATITRLVQAAAGADIFAAQSQVEQYSTSSGSCPVIGVLGSSVTLTGGCTDSSGVMLGGAALIDNPTSWEGVPYDGSQPTVYTFEQLTVTTASTMQSYNGLVSLLDSMSVYQADLDGTVQGVKVRSDLYLQCASAGSTQTSCRLTTSGVELSGRGGALVSGTILESSLGSQLTANLVLDGADTLTASIAQGCVGWTISDSSNAKTCP